MAISRRMPGWGQIVAVYAVIALIVYSWTLVAFIYRVPGWMFFMNMGEMLSILAYGCATNLFESLALLAVCLLPSLLLPLSWFHDRFVARGSALAMSLLGYLMFIAFQYEDKSYFPSFALSPWALAAGAVVALVLIYLAGRVPSARRALEFLADQTTVFLYISIPVSVLSIGLVAVRAVT